MLIRFLYWLLERKYRYLYKDIDKEVINRWLLEQNATTGFRDYFRIRDITLLKTLGNPQTQKDYWMTIGRRIELLFLVGKIEEQRKISESKKSNKKDYATQKRKK